MARQRRFAPARGDFIWIHFSPQAGTEMRGHHPAIVLSGDLYNRRVGRAVLCPITSSRKGFPFEVAIPDGLAVSGTIQADQVRCLDWRSRKAEFAGAAPRDVLDEVLARVVALLEY